MSELDFVRDCLKDLRGEVDDGLWQKLMSLFVHGEEVMAIEILAEELALKNTILSSEKKQNLTKALRILDVSPDEFNELLS